MKEYEISSKTLNDIIEKVPPEKFEVIMAELTAALIQARHSLLAARVLSEKAESTFNDPMTWIDDGKGDVSVRHSINKIHVLTTKEKVE